MTFQVFQLVIAKTRSVSPARKLRSDPVFPHISPRKMYHACPSLLTVFSTTQLGHLITQCGLCHHSFGDAASLVKFLDIQQFVLLYIKVIYFINNSILKLIIIRSNNNHTRASFLLKGLLTLFKSPKRGLFHRFFCSFISI